MDHTKLHKTNKHKRNEVTSSNDKISRRSRRRSIIQKEKRTDIVAQKRNLSPLKEASNVTKKAGESRRERLEIWKREKAKRLLKAKARAKPVFKVGNSSVSRNFATELKDVNTSKENKKKSTLPKEKPSLKPKKDIPCTSKVVTRQQKKDSKNIKQTDKPKQNDLAQSKKLSLKKQAEVRLMQSKSEQNRKKIKSRSEKTNCEKIQNHEMQNVPDSSKLPDAEIQSGFEDSEVFVERQSYSADPTDENEPNSSVAEQKTSQEERDEPAKLCEASFAPENFTFRVPERLNKFSFPDDFKSIAGVKGSILSSTPHDNVFGQENRVGPAIPLSITSASESSSDEANIDRKKDTGECTSTETVINVEAEAVDESISKQERVRHFRELVRSESENLSASCEHWEKVQQGNKSELSEEVVGEIRSVIGKAQLLIAERFNQFNGLVDKFLNRPEGEKPVNSTDLQGFWDMIYYQVVDVEKKFTELQKLKENKWNKEEHEEKNKTAKPVTRRKSRKSSVHREAARKRIEAARKALEDKRKMLDQNDGDQVQTFRGKTRSSSKVSGEKTPPKNVAFRTPKSNKRKSCSRSFRKTPCRREALSDDVSDGEQPPSKNLRKTPARVKLEPVSYSGESPTTSGSMDSKYLIPCDTDVPQSGRESMLDSLNESPTTSGLIDSKYLMSCDTSCIDTPDQGKTYSVESKTLCDSPPKFLHSTAATSGIFNTPGNSPARVLRSQKIAPKYDGMSPFLCAGTANRKNNLLHNESINLMSFSPVNVAASEYNSATTGHVTRQTTSKKKEESFSLI